MYDIRLIVLLSLCVVLFIVVMIQWMLLGNKNQDIASLKTLKDGYIDLFNKALVELEKLRNETLQRKSDVIDTLKLFDAIAKNKNCAILDSEIITLEV